MNEYTVLKGSAPTKGTSQASRKRLDDDDFLIDTEPVQHIEQVLSTTWHLPLHGQTEILLHSFGDSSSHCVVSERAEGEVTPKRLSEKLKPDW